MQLKSSASVIHLGLTLAYQPFLSHHQVSKKYYTSLQLFKKLINFLLRELDASFLGS